ncbi:MAG TPA: class I SAM-dependent methyltransferase [Thermoanaerobaculia bacterium]|nr:class I SAM-dependent methyltransferase [Thermoanaerobaculia bacterium]
MADEAPRAPRIEDFLDQPTRDLEAWRWLWAGDHRFPVRSHRGLMGRALVFFKRLLRPFVQVPQNDLWERQRIFNLILLERIAGLAATTRRLEDRVGHVEAIVQEGLGEVIRHHDALYARLDGKVDAHRADARELLAWARSALLAADAHGAAAAATHEAAADAVGVATERPVAPAPVLARAFAERGYVEFERRYRGTEEEIAERVAAYLPHLKDASPLLDLGCGRGEALRTFAAAGLAVRGVDSSAEMVEHCRAQGLDVVEGDLLEQLAKEPRESLGAVVSFHVIEHLPAAVLERLVALAFAALRPGGVLILETPSPLSLVVAARNFWLDPTHQRPVHPSYLADLARRQGFDEIEVLPLRPFPAEQRLPEVPLDTIAAELHPLADRVNRLRDRLDDLLFGEQDYGLVARKRL